MYSGYGDVCLTEGYSVLDTRILVHFMALFGADIRLKHTREYQRRASKPREKPQLFQIVSADEKPSF